jgi:hypothetical protein
MLGYNKFFTFGLFNYAFSGRDYIVSSGSQCPVKI